MGMLIDKISRMFHSLYQAFEKIVYPGKKLEEILALHMQYPEMSQPVGFLVLVYLFGYVYTIPEHYRLAFIIFGATSIFTIAYILRFLSEITAQRKDHI